MDSRGCAVSTLSQKVDDAGYVIGGCKSEDGKISCGYSSFRGKRASMEDFYDVKMSNINGNTVCLFGIFDGHGGSRAAEFLKQNLFENLMKHPQFLTDTKLAISETYKTTDTEFLDAEKDTCRDDGSTASTAILVQNRLYVANVGDSRAVVSQAGKAIPLSEDQKPNRSDERKRIESAGGVVMWAGTWRVGGVLAMSRAFGNRMLKQYVVAEPEIQEQEVNMELELIVLASDGLWDVVANEMETIRYCFELETVDLGRSGRVLFCSSSGKLKVLVWSDSEYPVTLPDAVSIARAEEEPESAARKLTETAFTRGSADNITCIVVKFNHDKGELGALQMEHIEETELHQHRSDEAEGKNPEAKPEQLESDAAHDQNTEAKLSCETKDSPAHHEDYFGSSIFPAELLTAIGLDRVGEPTTNVPSVNDKASKAIVREAAKDISTRVRIPRGKKQSVAAVEGATSSPRPHKLGGRIISEAFGSMHKRTEEVRRQPQVHDLCDSNTLGKEVPLVKRPSHLQKLCSTDVSNTGANTGHATSEALVNVAAPTGQFASNSTPFDLTVMTTIPVAGSVMSTTPATKTQAELLHKAALDVVNALGQHAICQEESAVFKEGQLIQKLNQDLINANAKATTLTIEGKRMAKEMSTLRDELAATKKREKELSALCYEQDIRLTTLKHRKASVEIANRSLTTEINVLLEKEKRQLLELLAIYDKVRVKEVDMKAAMKACWAEGYTTGDKECKDLIEQMYPDFDWAQFEKLEGERDARQKVDHPAT